VAAPEETQLTRAAALKKIQLSPVLMEPVKMVPQVALNSAEPTTAQALASRDQRLREAASPT